MKIRVVVMFEEDEFRLVKDNADHRFMEPKAFVKFAAKAYMDKYPADKRKSARAAQPHPIAGK